jgi:phospholipase C
VFDHTSIIRFIERRFGIHCPNISFWRRAICGDLMSAFDFSKADAGWPSLPDTRTYVADANRQCSSLPEPAVPAVQSLPTQERGTRPSRALPYDIQANGRVDADRGTFWISLSNHGKAGVALAAYDLATGDNTPRRYTLGAGSQVSDNWSQTQLTGTRYSIALHGPNGFLRTFSGDVAATSSSGLANPEIAISYNALTEAIELTLTNTGDSACAFTATANAYRTDGPWTFAVAPGRTAQTSWSVSSSGNWYDFIVTVDVQPAFLRRFAGRVENGQDLISDPAAA